jgi:hypothetical protein
VSTLTTRTGEEVDLSNLSLSRKEDFLLFAEAPPRVQPEQLTRSQLEALRGAARADRDRRLRVWHANLGPFETPQLADLHEDMWDIVDSNAQDGDKVKGAIAVDAFPGLGKTTAVLAFAKKFHLREVAENRRFTPDGHERLPVCRVGLTGNTSMKDVNRAMLEFYGHPGRHRGTTAQMAHRALDCVQSCHTRLLVIDDLHFLRWGRTNGIEVSNHFKYIANEFPVTLLMVGVGLAAKGLFSEGTASTTRRWRRRAAAPHRWICSRSGSTPTSTAGNGGSCCSRSNESWCWPRSFLACSPTSCRTTCLPAPPGTSAHS